jgi:hypothetical protein
MKGAILDKGYELYGFMDIVMLPFKDDFIKLNWLITDREIYYGDPRIDNNGKYVWIDGIELLEIIGSQKTQFVWGVFSGFNKDVQLEEILKYNLPYADGNGNFWNNKIEIQHPLAEIEIVSFDASLYLFICKDDELTKKFIEIFSLADDLEEYNKK